MLKSFKFLDPSTKQISIEAKLFAVLCLCMGLISVINIIVNFIVEVPVSLSIYIFVGVVIHSTFYYFALKDKTPEKVRFWYFVFNIVSIIPAWFLNGGSLGSIPLFFIFYLSIATLSLSDKYRYYFVFFFFISIGTCIGTEHFYPTIIVNYATEKLRIFDVLVSFFDVSVMMMFTLTMYRKVIDYDKIVLLKSKQRLETSQKKLLIAKVAAEAATAAKSTFLANMSHEIRTPLNGITGASELLKLTKLNIEQSELLNTLQASNSIMIDIVNDLLDISRIEANKMEIHNHPFEIRKCIKDAEDIVKPLLSKKNLIFDLTISKDVPKIIIADEIRYKQIIINLLSNAIKFTEKGNVSLSLKYKEHNGEKILSSLLKDTGIGIDPSDMKKLFVPFSQINPTITRKFGGAGLGLVICRKLAEMMGGNIFAVSEPEVGSEFMFTIPVEPYFADVGINYKTVRKESIIPIAGMHILIAEDNIFNQIITSKMLEKSGYKYAIANNGIEALEKAKNEHFNIILMDLQMPHMDGLSATVEILKHYPPNKIPPPIVIGCTANAMETDKEACFAAGMKDFLSKPFTLDDLRSVMIKWTKVDEY